MTFLLKLLGTVLILGGATAGGFYAAERLSDNTRLLSGMIRYWSAFLMTLREAAEPGEIARQLGCGSEFSVFPFAQEMAQASKESNDFFVVLETSFTRCDLPKDVMELLRPLGAVIGRNELIQQLRTLDNVISELTRKRETEESRQKKQGNLYRRLGFLGGVLAVVILL